LRARGSIIARSPCVIAGLAVAEETFRQMDPGCEFRTATADGHWCEAGIHVAEVHGLAGSMLTAERTALNFLQRLSGVATLTRRFVDRSGGRVTILDTRKTTPTLRALEQYAVRAGGGSNHRDSLDDGVLIKANHVALAGSIREAVQRVKASDADMSIEVEVRSIGDADDALAAGAHTLVVDRMSVEEIRDIVQRARGRAKVALTGAFDLDSLDPLASAGADYVSVGALTQSAAAADLRLDLARP
jgi:nicotinate-nucleotide pyrophosphorylase (carboxylating)